MEPTATQRKPKARRAYKPRADCPGAKALQAMMGKVHMIAKTAGIDPDTDEYRTWLAGLTGGKTSCKQLDRQELSSLCDRLAGKVPEEDRLPRPTAKAAGRVLPSAKQWLYLEQLAYRMGWAAGLKDSRLVQHVRHTAKVDQLGDCGRIGVSECIHGLERRLAQATARAESRAAGLDI